MKTKRFLVVLLMIASVISTTLVVYAESDTWIRPNCGQTASGNFCQNCGTANPNHTVSTSNPSVAAPSGTSEGGIHRYEYCVEDCSWSQAFMKAKEKGGYLAHIDSREEFDHLVSEISQKGMNSIRFMLGGRRDMDSTSYYWVDASNTTYGACLNSPDYWAYSAWMKGEPSITDGDIAETSVCMFFSSDYGSWVLNDVPENILAVVPDFSGKIGYIVEYENGAAGTDNVQSDPSKVPFEKILSEYRDAVSLYSTTQDQEIVREQCPDVNPLMIFYQNAYPDSTQLYYTYYDIDGNGVEELLIGHGGPDGSYLRYYDVFTTDGTSTYRFFKDDSMGDRSTLTIYTDGTMDVNGSGGAADGIESCWIIGADGYTPVKTLGYRYHYEEYTGKYYADIEGDMFPEDYENSLSSKTEISATGWTKI